MRRHGAGLQPAEDVETPARRDLFNRSLSERRVREIPCFVTKYLTLDRSVHLMAKVAVNGEQADAVWRWLKALYPGDVEWNFDALFLVDQTGEPVGRYTARELPRVEADLKYLLTQSGSA